MPTRQQQLWEFCQNDAYESFRNLISKHRLAYDYVHQKFSPLSIACVKENHRIVKALLSASASPDGCTAEENTPLCIASALNNCLITKLLLENEVRIDSVRGGASALYTACSNGSSDVVRLLLHEGAQINLVGPENKTPLAIACRKGYIDIVKLLLAADADINLPDSEGSTPLHYASYLDSTEILFLLLNAGACVEARLNANIHEHSPTPLLVACAVSNYGAVELLLNMGRANVNVNLENVTKATPLIVASQEGSSDIVELLLEAGAVLDRINAGETPLNAASSEGHLEVVEILLNAKADPNQRCYLPLDIDDPNPANGKVFPLLSACWKGHASVAHSLLAGCADPDQSLEVDSDTNPWIGVTPLYASMIWCNNVQSAIDCASVLGAYSANFVQEAPEILNELKLQADETQFDDSDTDLCLVDKRMWFESVVANKWDELWFSASAALPTRIIELARLGKIPRISLDKPLQLATTRCFRRPNAPLSHEVAAVLSKLQLPWSPETHHCFPLACRKAAFTIMCVLRRVNHFSAQARKVFEERPRKRMRLFGHLRDDISLLLTLPIELWESKILPFAIDRFDV